MKPKAKPGKKAWARVRLFAMDVDGILTDGSVYIASDGTETKRFSVLDGMGIMMLHEAGLQIAWISARMSGATTLRAEELKISHVIQGGHDKLGSLTALLAKMGLSMDQCVFMGDDVLDVPALRAAGIGVTVPNAMPVALAAARFVTRRAGGSGAVREVCDLLLSARGGASRNSDVRRSTI